jgi:glycerophosphoryl diester phosphodiesterase
VLGEAQARQVPVLCYTVNAPAEAEMLFARGVAAIFTDRLDLFAGA